MGATTKKVEKRMTNPNTILGIVLAVVFLSLAIWYIKPVYDFECCDHTDLRCDDCKENLTTTSIQPRMCGDEKVDAWWKCATYYCSESGHICLPASTDLEGNETEFECECKSESEIDNALY